MDEDSVIAAKEEQLSWLAKVFSADPNAISDEAADKHLFDRENDFGLDHFVNTARPLVKLREAKGDVALKVGTCQHTDPDRSYVSLTLDDETVFEVVVRFEEALPCRIRYWMFYPPLPDGIKIRRYAASDAAGCVALERVCPMEMKNGDRWIVDRGEYFDDYLKLMEDIDAAVVVAGDKVIGFYSCALRPIRYNDADAYCVYQHHYRVHPDYRSGSVSMALASFVDARRTFENQAVQFPYSLIDPENAHMQNMGFPHVEGVQIARLSIPLSNLNTAGPCYTPDVAEVCELVNKTHADRAFFQTATIESMHERCHRVTTYNFDSFRSNGKAVLGIWVTNELNILDQGGSHQELRLSFALDYGFSEVEALIELLNAVAPELRDSGTTHLSFLMDTRSEEYPALANLSDDAQLLNVHTLPWITDSFAQQTVYCDAVYS